MDHKTVQQELAYDLAKLQSLISELAGKESAEEFVAAGPVEQVEKKFKELLELVMKLTEKYKDSPVKIRGFSVTLGALIVNSSASINFEF